MYSCRDYYTYLIINYLDGVIDTRIDSIFQKSGLIVADHLPILNIPQQIQIKNEVSYH